MKTYKIRITASNFAKYAGCNQFCDEAERTSTFWKHNQHLARKLGRYDVIEDEPPPVTRVEAHVKAAPQSVRKQLCEALGAPVALVAAPALIASAIQDRVVAPAVKQKTAAKADAALKTDVARTLPAEVQTVIAHDVQLQRGVKREASNLDNVQQTTGRVVTARNNSYMDCKLFDLPLSEDDNVCYEVWLSGLIDGAFADTGHVVEAKERRNRLFRRVVPYECVQLHCYMHLTNTSRALLRERLDEEAIEHWVDFDPVFWDTCLQKLRDFLSTTCYPSMCDNKTE